MGTPAISDVPLLAKVTPSSCTIGVIALFVLSGDVRDVFRGLLGLTEGCEHVTSVPWLRAGHRYINQVLGGLKFLLEKTAQL